MPDKYQALREAAEKATPGEWVSYVSTGDEGKCYANVYPARHVKGFLGVIAGQKTNRANSQMNQRADNIRYIAAANPVTIQALLTERDALRTALQTAQNGLRWYCDEYPEQVYECDHEAMAQIDAALSQ